MMYNINYIILTDETNNQNKTYEIYFNKYILTYL